MEISRRPSRSHWAWRIKRLELVTIQKSSFESLETFKGNMRTVQPLVSLGGTLRTQCMFSVSRTGFHSKIDGRSIHSR